MNINLYNILTLHRSKAAITKTGKLNPWIFVCSGSIALHSIHSNIQYRKIKDIDIYLLDSKENRKRIPYEIKKIHGRSILESSFDTIGLHLDIFSNGYLSDGIVPFRSDVLDTEISGNHYLHPSIEHSLMLKMLTTCLFRPKEMIDIQFMLNSFKIDNTLCEQYFLASKYVKIINRLPRINAYNVKHILESFEERIVENYRYLDTIIEIRSIPFEYLVTLLNYETFSVTKETEYVVDTFNAFLYEEGVSRIKRQIYVLGALYFFNQNVRHSREMLHYFLCKIYHSSKGVKWLVEPAAIFLKQTRHLGKIINVHDFDKKLDLLLGSGKLITGCFSFAAEA